MKLSTRLTMRGLVRTLKALAHARAEALDTPRGTPREREPAGRRLAARRARRAWETGGGDGRHGA